MVTRILVLLVTAATMVLVGARPVAAQEIVHFTAPSKNIDCMIYTFDSSTSVGCLVESASWKKRPARPSDCELDWSPTEISLSSETTGSKRVNSVSLGSCRGDIGPLCASGNDGCTTLGYGKTATLGPITCTSKTSGIMCVTNAGPKRGFTVNRAGYTLLR